MTVPPDTPVLPPFEPLFRDGRIAQVHRYYGGPFQHFESISNEASDWDVAATLGELSEADRHILEIGCGSGRLTLPIAGTGRLVTAIDNAAAAIARLEAAAIAAGLADRIRPIVADVHTAAALPMHDAAVIGGLTAHVLAEPALRAAVALAGHSVRPGGRILTTLFSDEAASAFERAFPAQEPAIRSRAYQDETGRTCTMRMAGRFDPRTRRLDQNWAVDADGGADAKLHFAAMTSWLWTTADVETLYRDHGFEPIGRTQIPAARDRSAGLTVILTVGRRL